MNHSEAEIQILASLDKAGIAAAPTDGASLEKSGARYGVFLEDWSGAFASLIAKGLIEGGAHGYRLTPSGGPLGRAYHRERPDLYWYYFPRFYAVARASPTHARFCAWVFGRDLCQLDTMDMAALEELLERLDLKPGDHLLDLGCGAGGIAEYISDRTGARVTGLDRAAPAIAEANDRTVDKRSRLTFLTGDLNALDLPEGSFDAAISIDALYWVADLEATLSKVVGSIKPGGRIGIYALQLLADGDSPDRLEADNTDLSQALARLKLTYDSYDETTRNIVLWYRIRQAATALHDDFEAEGNGFIAANWIREAEEEILPLVEAGRLARYLYHLRL